MHNVNGLVVDVDGALVEAGVLHPKAAQPQVNPGSSLVDYLDSRILD